MSFFPNQLQNFSLAGAGVVAGDTSVTLKSMLDIDGNALTMAADFGTIGYATLEPGNNTLEESISFSGLTNNANGTTTLTGVKSITFAEPYTPTTGFMKNHAGSTTLVISNTSAFYTQFGKLANNETVTGLWLVPDPVSATGIANKEYVLSVVNGGPVSFDKLIVTATAGETVAAGQVLYLKVADGLWYKASSAASATTDFLQLAIAQGAGTIGNPITNGVLIRGVDTNQSGLVVGTTYYLSTGGAIASSAGTIERAVGQGASTTSIYFDPNYFYTPTGQQKSALPGMAGTLSSTNKYSTGISTQNQTAQFAAAAGSANAFTLTLSPVPTAYAAGQRFSFTANNANTGTCTLNVNGLGAVQIFKFKNVGLEVGDIKSGQVVEVSYDGTNFEMQSGRSSVNLIALAQNVALTTSGEQTLISTTLLGGTLGTANAVRIKGYVIANTSHGSGGTFTLKLYYGATTIFTTTAITTDGNLGTIEMMLVGAGSTSSQQCDGVIDLTADGTATNLSQTHTRLSGSAAENSTTDLLLKLTGNWQNGGGSFTMNSITIERVI